MMIYKVVSAPKVVEADSGMGASKVFEDLINREAAQGWKFVSMESITSMTKPGCLKQPVATSHNMLIFCKDNI